MPRQSRCDLGGDCSRGCNGRGLLLCPRREGSKASKLKRAVPGLAITGAQPKPFSYPPLLPPAPKDSAMPPRDHYTAIKEEHGTDKSGRRSQSLPQVAELIAMEPSRADPDRRGGGS